MTTHNVPRGSLWTLAVGVGGVIILGIVIVFSLGANQPSNNSPSTTSSQQNAEPVTTTSEPTGTYLPTVTSVGIVELENSQRATGEANRAIKDPTFGPSAVPYTMPPFPTGIFEGGEGILYSGQYKAYNRWQGLLNGQPTIVIAGALREHPSQGFVFVQTSYSIHGSVIESLHLTPIQAGAVTIVAESNLRLTLNAETGDVLYFDIPSRQFIASLDAPPLATATERILPTPTSVPPQATPGAAAEATAPAYPALPSQPSLPYP